MTAGVVMYLMYLKTSSFIDEFLDAEKLQVKSCNDELSCKKRLGVAGIAFKASDPHQPAKRLFVEPMLATLARKDLAQHRDLSGNVVGIDRHVEIWSHQVAVPFWYFILPNLMRTKRVPGQFVNHPVILMRVGLAVSQDQIGVHRLQGLLEELLDLLPFLRKVGVGEALQNQCSLPLLDRG